MAVPLRDAFAHELALLGLRLLDESEEAQAALALARRCVGSYDTLLVEAVERRERAAATIEAEIVRRVESLLALQAPVAGDLRFVLATLAAAQHVQRASRNALRAVRVATPSAGVHAEEAIVACVEEMADRAGEMLRSATAAFARRDAAAARRVVDEDLVVDALHADAAHRVLDLAREPALREWSIGVLFSSRWFERAADHAVAVADGVPYLLQGAPPWQARDLA